MNNAMVEGRGARDERQKRASLSTLDSRLSTARSGVALVITVILLAVVTFMAITFLAVSRRERNSVTTTTDTATARLAADDALASAEAQIMANTLATTNPYNFGLLVSTNYINYLGFTPGSVSPTNVNYDYLIPAAGGGSLDQNQFLQNLANLQYLPRPPVFYQTNANANYPLDFRYYLDLNRNGQDEPNGLWPVISPDPNNPYYYYNPNNSSDPQNGQTMPNIIPGDTLSNLVVGDPDWVGVLQHPDQPYGPNNPFVARYAFVAVPIGNALDLNHIFNQVLDVYSPAARNNYVRVNPLPFATAGFLRNQGVGPWEINLAAFFADLNTNSWDNTHSGGFYQYLQPAFANTGAAFDDARALLAYRYGNNYMTLKPANQLLFTPSAFPNGVFPNDGIDEYGNGPLQINTALINETLAPNSVRDNPAVPWAGAPNTNHFFSVDDLFNPAKANIGAPSALSSFTNRLRSASTNYSTYDRYTYYRLLAQMGVDSAPEQNKINLNYSNAFASFDANGVVTNITFYPNAQTNLTLWTPLQFFTIAADRMLREYSQEWLLSSPSNYLATYGVSTNIGTQAYPTNMPIPFGISDIPVLVSNRFVYTPAVQRVLQLAANIYDATTNTYLVNGNNRDYPSVFRPIFRVAYDPVSGYTNVYIAGYEPVQTLVNGVEQIGAVSGPGDYQLAMPVTVANLLNPDYNYTYSPSGHFGLGVYTNVNVYGVPWIIGAKKGFPNFNEFAMESVFQLTRKLQVTRPSTNSPLSDYKYNQMYLLSLSNQFGVECWNSYTNSFLDMNFPDSVSMYVTCTNTCLFTNDEGFSTTRSFSLTGYLPINQNSNQNNGWPGYNPQGSGAQVLRTPASFQLPLLTKFAIITNSEYRFNTRGNRQELWAPYVGIPYLTTNLSWPFESNVVVNVNGTPISYPQPHWWLMDTNNLRVIMLDGPQNGVYHIIDYVQLRGPNTTRDLTSEILNEYDKSAGPSGEDMWNPIVQSGIPSGPIGLISQIGVSLDTLRPPPLDWKNRDSTQVHNEIDGFRAFFGLGAYYNNVGSVKAVNEAKMTNAIQAPYTPTATVVQHVSWQANDPLVHYTASDLNWAGAVQLNITADNLTNENIGKLNQRYMPWGGNPTLTNADKNPCNLALKDPLVWRSDDWDFPTYKLPGVGWLGRVHRGTPWQSVYLKSANILRAVKPGTTNDFVGTNVWEQWTGDSLLTYQGTNREYYDAINMAPAQDRLLFDIFSTAPDANATRGQLSVNVDASNPSSQAGLAAWSALFSGVQVLSNNAAYPLNQHNGSMVDYTNFPVNPAGPDGANSAIGQIVTGINQTRADFVNADGLGGTFEHVGDILSVPQLTVQSPFLNKYTFQQTNGISDELYEWLPQQVMSLLRVSGTPQSPMRYVIYSYGQALKPAQGAIYTGGGLYFGMVTNYQVVAESATRTVVNFGSVVTNVPATIRTNLSTGNLYWSLLPRGKPVVTNNTAQIEQFNVLPPD